MSHCRVLYVPWWKQIMSIGLMLNSTGIHWQICTKRKPVAIFTNAFCSFKVLSYLPFCICDQIFFKRRRRRRGEGEDEGERRGRGRGCKNRLCVLPAFLHLALFLFCNLTSSPITQGKLSSQRSPITLNYQMERLFINSCFHVDYETVDTQWVSSPSFINFSFQGFRALFSPEVPLSSFKNTTSLPFPPPTWRHFHKCYS